MKVWNYVFVTMTLLLVLQFAGFPTALSGIFDFFNIGFATDFTLENVSISSSSIMDYFFLQGGGWLTAIAATGVGIGLYFAGKPDIAIKAALATAVFTSFIPSLYIALTYSLASGFASWIVAVFAVIFIPYTIGFFFALVEYVVGGNTD